jgi:hypothetical protein
MKKSLTVAIVLTIIPITDFLGANWFYLGYNKIGIAKLCLLLAFILSGAALNFGLLFLLLVVILWWLIDIPLIAGGKFQPK